MSKEALKKTNKEIAARYIAFCASNNESRFELTPEERVSIKEKMQFIRELSLKDQIATLNLITIFFEDDPNPWLFMENKSEQEARKLVRTIITEAVENLPSWVDDTETWKAFEESASSGFMAIELLKSPANLGTLKQHDNAFTAQLAEALVNEPLRYLGERGNREKHLSELVETIQHIFRRIEKSDRLLSEEPALNSLLFRMNQQLFAFRGQRITDEMALFIQIMEQTPGVLGAESREMSEREGGAFAGAKASTEDTSAFAGAQASAGSFHEKGAAAEGSSGEGDVKPQTVTVKRASLPGEVTFKRHFTSASMILSYSERSETADKFVTMTLDNPTLEPASIYPPITTPTIEADALVVPASAPPQPSDEIVIDGEALPADTPEASAPPLPTDDIVVNDDTLPAELPEPTAPPLPSDDDLVAEIASQIEIVEPAAGAGVAPEAAEESPNDVLSRNPMFTLSRDIDRNTIASPPESKSDSAVDVSEMQPLELARHIATLMNNAESGLSRDIGKPIGRWLIQFHKNGSVNGAEPDLSSGSIAPEIKAAVEALVIQNREKEPAQETPSRQALLIAELKRNAEQNRSSDRDPPAATPA